MYVTRPLSLYKKYPASLSQPPPEGPNSGYLVIQDEESETYCCLGCKQHAVYDMPLPQNKLLTVRYASGSSKNRHVSYDDVYFIPVLNQPLSSNRYYAIKPHGRHKGEAYTNSKEEDVMTCCFCNFVKDIGTSPLEPYDMYQQVEIFRHDKIFSSGFAAKSVTPDGYPPYFLRRKGWDLRTSAPNYCHELGEANGLNVALRSKLPAFDFPLSYKDTEPIVVGKWYTPFMFVKEGNLSLRDQMKLSMFYEITLQQKWQQIFACENHGNKGNAVDVDVIVQSEAISIGPGREVLPGDMKMVDGFMWYRSVGGVEGEVSVGLSLAIVERMKWEQERVGHGSGREGQVRVNTVQEFGGVGEWRRFGCYVLVERFVLKRMDGSLLMTHEFKHSHQIRSKWE